MTDDLLRELIAEVRGLRADMRAKALPSLSRADQATLGGLLPTVGGALGSDVFNSADIHEHESAALRVACAGLSVRQLGRLLRRAADTPIGGYMVQRVGAEAGAVLWRVVEVPEFPGNGKVSVPHARSGGRA